MTPRQTVLQALVDDPHHAMTRTRLLRKTRLKADALEAALTVMQKAGEVEVSRPPGSTRRNTLVRLTMTLSRARRGSDGDDLPENPVAGNAAAEPFAVVGNDDPGKDYMVALCPVILPRSMLPMMPMPPMRPTRPKTCAQRTAITKP